MERITSRENAATVTPLLQEGRFARNGIAKRKKKKQSSGFLASMRPP